MSEKRNLEAAKAFLSQAQEVAKQLPERVVADGLTSYRRTIASEASRRVAKVILSGLKKKRKEEKFVF